MNTTQTPDDTIHGWTMDFSIPGLSLNSPSTSTPPAEIRKDLSVETPPPISAQSQVTLPSIVYPPSPVHQPESTPVPEEAVGSTVCTPPAEDLDGPDPTASESSAGVPPRVEATRSIEPGIATVVSPWVRDSSHNAAFEPDLLIFRGSPCCGRARHPAESKQQAFFAPLQRRPLISPPFFTHHVLQKSAMCSFIAFTTKDCKYGYSHLTNSMRT